MCFSDLDLRISTLRFKAASRPGFQKAMFIGNWKKGPSPFDSGALVPYSV
jgi:hypothetical protein